MSGGDLKVTAKGAVGNGRTSTIKFSPKTTFSYLLMKPKWDHAKRKKRTRMVSGTVDQWGS